MSNGKAALVTGAAAGIGAGIAERLVEAGFSVTLFDIDEEGVGAMAKKLGSRGLVLAIQGDVAIEEQVQSAVERTSRELGPADVLVNNAGIEVGGSVTDLSTGAWDRQLAVNLRGTFLMSKYVIPTMKGRGGSIINISSVHAIASWRNCAAYDASKAALVGLTRAMALDHGPQGIRVNAICPGYIDTPLMEKWMSAEPDRDATMRRILSYHPLGRIGTPRDIAETVLFLVSEAASFISGATFVVDGALMAAGH